MMRHPAQPTKVIVSTVVHVRNRLVRLYLFLVAPAWPVHKIIVPAMPARGFGTGPA